MHPQLHKHNLQPTSAQKKLPHMHGRNCLQAAFRRLSQNRTKAVTMAAATSTSCCQCVCYCQLHSASSLRHQTYRRYWTKHDNDSFTSTSLLLHNRAHALTQVQTDTSSSHVAIAANESETTESDSEDDIAGSADASQSSLASTVRIDEAVTGYLQSDAASETTMHRSAEEAREQVCSCLCCHTSAALPVAHRAAS